MDIFELVDNEKFFHPLSSQNRRIYYECILSLIEKSREVPVLYDSDARNCVALYLRNSKYVFQDEQGKGRSSRRRTEAPPPSWPICGNAAGSPPGRSGGTGKMWPMCL